MTIEEVKKELQNIIDKLNDENNNEDTQTLEEEARKLTKRLEELTNMEERKKIAESINNNMVEAQKITDVNDEEARNQAKVQIEQRAKDLKEGRAIQVSSNSLLLPKKQSTEITDKFNEVSTLVDEVKIMQINGGESYQVPYVKSYGEGDQTDEGKDYHETEPEFAYADINKIKLTAYTEITEEAEKLPDADYVKLVEDNIDIALKKKMIENIVNGNGTKSFIGILNNTKEITEKAKIEIEKIDNDTLDEIVFSYGGDEDVEQNACLILSKEDLKAFSKLRTTDGRKLHNIDVKNKTIDTIHYITCSRLKPISKDGTDGNMIYGSLSNYEIGIFSNKEIMQSKDYKFKQGITAYRGSVMAGGNTIKLNGFLIIKKKSSVTPKKTITIKLAEGEAYGKNVSDLQEVELADDKVTGTLKYVKEYDKFEKGAEGNFLAIEVEEAKNGDTVSFELSDSQKNGTGKLTSKDYLLVAKIHDNTQTITLRNGETSKVLDLTGLTLSPSE